MISTLVGIITAIDSVKKIIIVEAHGVGYEVHLCAPEMDGRSIGESIGLHVKTIYGQHGGVSLYGFTRHSDLVFWDRLRKLPKVGPGRAQALMTLSAKTLVYIIAEGREGDLTKIKGVGPSLAKRVVDELKEWAEEKVMKLEGMGGMPC